ncbi:MULTISPECIES: ParB/RepB/Spo0J family partition protein [Arcicella]|uniref:ParB/RepB/Spo0J family partition protein n=1 Tax=Arcicella aquatica TaxID=217141 RepID=A0ABU5QNM7_9BACT|nr:MULTISPECIES: ParB/RepB/Spo0J family partition protein [Arcicella]MDR6563020.1 ParB family chromosome partitioning protein [Arcicella sp. BE51]MDR6813104.1 ParB family chromosome partitioning protein [Arcicella sp. BE140]MDR6824418.1 ParB family chromosome partitioning protein [Arcicella sp. BE139]MEA5258673.1 ParB/RepB/Spo0J family partition protein [Arcicella aquatica]
MSKVEIPAVKKRVGLGRGLGALLQDSDEVNNTQSRHQPATPIERPTRLEQISSMNEISVDLIETNPYQPRTHFDEEALNELADSIRVQGIIQPITVRQIAPNKFQLISGERRLQASKRAGLKSIPAYVRTADDQQMLEMALIENIQRENLNAIEIALSYQRLITECSLKQEELGDRVGKNRTTVNNYIRLLKLPDVIQVALRDTKISMGHARAIINIPDREQQLDIFQKTIADDWSVRKVEEAVRELANASLVNTAKKAIGGGVKQEIRSLQFRLQAYFGAKVTVKADDKGKGEIKIPFTSQEELDKILLAIKA